MSKTVLADIKGWTPVIDSIVERHGIMTAVVFGVVWRYCQMKDGKCTASQSTIAKTVQLERKTALRHLKILVDDGYLNEAHIPGQPTIYYDTGKAALKVVVEANDKPEGVPETDNQPPVPVPENPLPVPETDRGCTSDGQEGVPETDTKIDIKKEYKKEEERGKIFANSQAAIDVFKHTVGFTPEYTGQLRAWELIKDILNNHADYGREELAEHIKRYADDWRSRRTKDGRPYRIRNLAWLEQAAADEAIVTPAQAPAQGATDGPNGGYYV